MTVTDLKLANVRSITMAELSFQPGFNLVVGDNGAGKTTVLEALAVCISEFVRSRQALTAPLILDPYVQVAIWWLARKP